MQLYPSPVVKPNHHYQTIRRANFLNSLKERADSSLVKLTENYEAGHLGDSNCALVQS